ncbi:MAG: histidine kinase [Gammaproteobacteria bacterium]|nr:MAG: histidine kinase [Gammaproteobacteria bacterium]
MLDQKDSWITVIRRQVYNMIGLVILFIFIGAGFFSWQNSVLSGLQEHANEYHLASTTHYLKASDELQNILIALLSGTPVSGSTLESPRFNNQSAMYIIQQEVNAAHKLQTTYADGQFDALLNMLDTSLVDVVTFMGAVQQSSTASEQFKNELARTQKSLSQLVRLHSIAREGMMDKIHSHKNRKNIILFVLSITLLVAAIFITRRGLGAIQAAIDERVAYEEERKSIEKQLRQSQKMDAIGQLTGGIAHDFNNILGIIIGNLDLLKFSFSAEGKVLQYLTAIETAADRAANVTKQLLVFSRQQAADVAAVDINRAISSMDILTTLTVSPQIEVSENLATDLWLTDINFGDLQDALLNLVINARDAMSAGGRLTIETRNATLDSAYCSQHPTAQPGEYVQLSISDTGTGISVDLQERIFEPFFTTKAEGKGTGLGLAMVFGFIERSKGHIKLYSEQGIGTTFHVYLPRSKMKEEVKVSSEQGAKALPTGNETILVVDDEPGLVAIAQESLQLLGYHVLTASDGNQAMEQLAAEPSIDLLFSDVVMPGGMNGYQLAEGAVEAMPELKVLLASGYTKKAISQNGQARFDANLLNKPYTQSELALQIRSLLDQS